MCYNQIWVRGEIIISLWGVLIIENPNIIDITFSFYVFNLRKYCNRQIGYRHFTHIDDYLLVLLVVQYAKTKLKVQHTTHQKYG